MTAQGQGGVRPPLGHVGQGLELHISHTNLWSQVMTKAGSTLSGSWMASPRWHLMGPRRRSCQALEQMLEAQKSSLLLSSQSSGRSQALSDYTGWKSLLLTFVSTQTCEWELGGQVFAGGIKVK